MKTLTIKQPWAALIAAGIKRVENRTWSTDYRGPLAIHAASTDDNDGTIDYWAMTKHGLTGEPRSALIAIVELIDIWHNDHKGFPANLFAIHDLKFATGPYCWILRNPRHIAPVPCRGHLGLWETDFLRDKTTAIQ